MHSIQKSRDANVSVNSSIVMVVSCRVWKIFLIVNQSVTVVAVAHIVVVVVTVQPNSFRTAIRFFSCHAERHYKTNTGILRLG